LRGAIVLFVPAERTVQPMKFNHRLHCAAADWSETWPNLAFALRCGIGTEKVLPMENPNSLASNILVPLKYGILTVSE
jgi:hypothetical protein